MAGASKFLVFCFQADLLCPSWMQPWVSDCSVHSVFLVFTGWLQCCCYMAGALWNCCHLSAISVYTIQSCTSLQCHFIWSHKCRMHVFSFLICLFLIKQTNCNHLFIVYIYPCPPPPQHTHTHLVTKLRWIHFNQLFNRCVWILYKCYLLNCWTFCNQIWYCGTSLWSMNVVQDNGFDI